MQKSMGYMFKSYFRFFGSRAFSIFQKPLVHRLVERLL